MELHDSTSQHLVALGLGIARLRQLVAGARSEVVLDDMSKAVREVMKEIRILSYLMRPPSLERGGLQATVRDFVEGFGTRTGLEVGFQASGAVDDISPGVRHAAFRIVQEALSNVYRHAHATRTEVALEQAAGILTVRVADDGQGIAKLRAGDPEGLQLGVGIDGMRTRVGRLGGDLEIVCPDRGTWVVARIPIHGEEAAAPAN
jgi:signal transduction histidine kinase